MLSFIFSGCTRIEYVEGVCPRIEILSKVQPIEVGGDANSTIQRLITGASQLRKSETYYIEQITKYHMEFVDKE